MNKYPSFFLIVTSLSLSACAAWQAHRDGISQMQEGKVEAGLSKMEQATKLEPENLQYKADFFRQRDQAIADLLQQIDAAEREQNWDRANEINHRLLALDPRNQRAKQNLLRLEKIQYAYGRLEEIDALLAKGALDEAAVRLQGLDRVVQNDEAIQVRQERLALLVAIRDRDKRVLSEQFDRTVSLELRDAGLRQIFEILSKEAKINFILDKDVRADLRATVFLKSTPLKDIIRFICTTNQLQYKVLNENTLMVFPATDEKQRLYDDLNTRTFYLSAVGAKEMASLIKDMTRLKDVYSDDQLNAVTVRASAEVLGYVEKLVMGQDISRPEVMLDLEVLEASSRLLDEIGIRYPTSAGVSLQGAAGAGGVLTLSELKNANSSLYRVKISDPALLLNLREETGDSKILANPRIRVKNKASAKVHIGDKVPLVSSTINGTSTVSESISYLDVGLKLDVEPNIKIDNEVEIKVGLEVSNLIEKIVTPAGSQAYRIGTRTASTVLTLKDGETQVLAGLVRREESAGVTGIPGLGRLPLLGPLFSSHRDESARSEIVLLITPRILRNTTPRLALQSFQSGTEAKPGAQPLLLPSLATQAPSGVLGSSALPEEESDDQGAMQWSLPLFAKAGESVDLLLKVNRKKWRARSFSGQLSFDPYRVQVLEVSPSSTLTPLLSSEGIVYQINNQQGRLLLAGKLGNQAPDGDWVKVKLAIKPAAQGPIVLTSDSFAAQDQEGKPLRLPVPLEQKITVMP